LTDEIIKLKNNVEKINKQMMTFARRRDLKEIEHMLELIGPIEPKIDIKTEEK